MIEWLTEKVAALCEKYGRVEYITGSGGRDDVYMIRYFVIKSRWLNLYIHRFMRSDRDDLHDHPWNFVTYLVRGAYTEKKWNPKTKTIDVTRRFNHHTHGPIKANVFVYRRATDQHQVITDQVYTMQGADNAPLTVCLTGPKIRDWGFIKETTMTFDESLRARLHRDMFARGSKISLKKRVWIPYQMYFNQEKNQ